MKYYKNDYGETIDIEWKLAGLKIDIKYRKSLMEDIKQQLEKDRYISDEIRSKLSRELNELKQLYTEDIKEFNKTKKEL